MIITEDYVSFETAKLLKKKGFNYPCRVVYLPKGIVKHYLKEEVYAHHLKGHKKVCPTLQMAMKWLRIEHNIHIRTSPYGPYPNNSNIFKYKFEIITMFYETMICVVCHKDEGYKSNEEACEAAIKYCLETMITIKEIDKHCSPCTKNEYLEPKKCFLPEEALNLIKLGLDINTSDMEFEGQPTWSVDRILKLFPNIKLRFDIRITCYAYGDEGELIVKETGDCQQDVLYRVVCYMLKNYGNN